MSIKKEKRTRRHNKIRKRIMGTTECPRLFVFRSLNHIYAQLVDDQKNQVIESISDKAINGKHKKVELAKKVGEAIAKKALEKKIEKAVFDRGGLTYHGRIKAVAEGARSGGLKF